MATYFFATPSIDTSAEDPTVPAALVDRRVTVRNTGGEDHSNLNVNITPAVPDTDEPAGGTLPLISGDSAFDGSLSMREVTFVLPAGYEVRITRGMGSGEL